ncbi:hypothetical protein QX233_22480, partial [Chryseobacterium gambrini]|nr:hypothetical protein [Chryseobacterium gambrini]
DFDDRLAVPPFSPEEVTGRFRRRFVGLLDSHPGVAVVDLDTGVVRRDGATDDPPVTGRPAPSVPDRSTFPAAAYRACRTDDQGRAVAALERL